MSRINTATARIILDGTNAVFVASIHHEALGRILSGHAPGNWDESVKADCYRRRWMACDDREALAMYCAAHEAQHGAPLSVTVTR